MTAIPPCDNRVQEAFGNSIFSAGEVDQRACVILFGKIQGFYNYNVLSQTIILKFNLIDLLIATLQMISSRPSSKSTSVNLRLKPEEGIDFKVSEFRKKFHPLFEHIFKTSRSHRCDVFCDFRIVW